MTHAIQCHHLGGETWVAIRSRGADWSWFRASEVRGLAADLTRIADQLSSEAGDAACRTRPTISVPMAGVVT